MIPRPYQRRAIDKTCQALNKYGNTLLVSATGSGKTVMLSHIVKKQLNGSGRALIMAHRDELTRQNSTTFQKINPEMSVSFFNADRKSFRGQAVFSMVQTLSQDHNLHRMPSFNLIVVDECHRIASDSYRKIISKAKENNPDVEVLGVTATPERSDRRGLQKTFSNVADIITISDLIPMGFLVQPKAMVIDIGTQHQLRNVKRTANDYNQAEVEAIQNTHLHNRQIVDKWMELARNRQTVVFCSTINHSVDVCDVFKKAGVAAEVVHGNLPMNKRREVLRAYSNGEIQLLTNPNILTEGFDDPLTSCIILLRPSSHKSVMIQQIGRGLRKIDPRKYPGVIKSDCIVLDFGISLLTHGDLEATVKLKTDGKKGESEVKKKKCPDCKSEQPPQTRICPLCGYEFKVELDECGFFDEEEEFRLIEIDLINKSPFRWVSLWDSEKILISNGFNAWACVCSVDGENWFSLGGLGKKTDILAIANRIGAIASADDFMRQHETGANAKKAARWMNDPASQKQNRLVNQLGIGGSFMSKVEAGAYITFGFNRNTIENLMGIA